MGSEAYHLKASRDSRAHPWEERNGECIHPLHGRESERMSRCENKIIPLEGKRVESIHGSSVPLETLEITVTQMMQRGTSASTINPITLVKPFRQFCASIPNPSETMEDGDVWMML